MPSARETAVSCVPWARLGAAPAPSAARCLLRRPCWHCWGRRQACKRMRPPTTCLHARHLDAARLPPGCPSRSPHLVAAHVLVPVDEELADHELVGVHDVQQLPGSDKRMQRQAGTGDAHRGCQREREQAPAAGVCGSSRQASERASKQAGRQASEQASKQVRMHGTQASTHASTQVSTHTPKAHTRTTKHASSRQRT